MAPLIICIVLIVATYIAQNQLIKNIYLKTGKYLKTGRLWPTLAFLGLFLTFGVYMYARMYGDGIGDVIDESLALGPIYIGVIVVSWVALIVLLVRNIKGAGPGMGILLTVLQTLSGVAILFLGMFKLGTAITMQQLGGKPITSSASPSQQAKQEAERKAWERERAEAYAQHDGFSSGQEAADAGMYSGDPDLLHKD